MHKHYEEIFDVVADIFLSRCFLHPEDADAAGMNYNTLQGFINVFTFACFCYGGEICYMVLNGKSKVMSERTKAQAGELARRLDEMRVPKHHQTLIKYIACKWLKYTMRRNRNILHCIFAECCPIASE